MDEETREDYIRRLAKNRYDMRQTFKWKMSDTAQQDWEAAVEQVRQEEIRNANN